MNKPSVFTQLEIDHLQGSLLAFNISAQVRKHEKQPVVIEVTGEESYTISKTEGKTGIPYYELQSDDRQIVSSNRRKFVDAVLNEIIN